MYADLATSALMLLELGQRNETRGTAVRRRCTVNAEPWGFCLSALLQALVYIRGRPWHGVMISERRGTHLVGQLAYNDGCRADHQ